MASTRAANASSVLTVVPLPGHARRSLTWIWTDALTLFAVATVQVVDLVPHLAENVAALKQAGSNSTAGEARRGLPPFTFRLAVRTFIPFAFGNLAAAFTTLTRAPRRNNLLRAVLGVSIWFDANA